LPYTLQAIERPFDISFDRLSRSTARRDLTEISRANASFIGPRHPRSRPHSVRSVAHPLRRLAPSRVVELDPTMPGHLSPLPIPGPDERTDANLAVGSGRQNRW
jgi:hypothetical protein